jgi:sn-glycerol 3-phosphate transport system substrate-binding protein
MYSRITFRLSLFVLLALFLAACPAPAAPPAAPPAVDAPAIPEETVGEPITIQVFYPVAVDAPIANILQGYVDAFMDEHPNITVQPVFAGGYADVKTTIQTTVEGGGTPPALAVMLATDLYDLVNADLIVPLDEYITDADWADNFYPAFLANSIYDDQTWSVPFQRSVVALYYNADLLEEAGLGEPQSWADLSAAAGDLTVREGDQATRWGILYPSDWPYWLFQPLAIGAGQNIFDPEGDTTVYFDHPAVIQAIQFYNDLSAEFNAMPAGVQANWGQAPSAFAGGDAAMIVHSSGSLSGILDQADFEVGVMPIPGQEPGSFATVTGGGNLYIMNHVSAAEQQAAWQFIEFLTQPELVADFSIATGYIAAQPAAYETDAMQDYLAETPQAAELRDMLDYAGAELSLQNLGEVRNIFHRHLQAAFNTEVSPAAAMATAQEEADRALAPFRE